MDMRAKVAEAIAPYLSDYEALDVADAVLDALKTPTPEMVEAGDDSMDSDCYFECNGERAWAAMIAASRAK